VSSVYEAVTHDKDKCDVVTSIMSIAQAGKCLVCMRLSIMIRISVK
jgi:hypothetical protein